MAQNELIRKKYKNLILFFVCLVIIKIAFAFFGSRYNISVSLVSDLFTSVLNTENVVSLTNASRKRAGLKELKISKRLEDAATQKVEDILKDQYFAHVSPAGRTPWSFMEDAGYGYIFAGENLAIGFDSSEEVSAGWMTSAGHKENILSTKYTEIGIGISRGKFLGAETTVVVQMFGNPLRSSALISELSSAKKKSKKSPSIAKRKTLLARSTLKPRVKGISIENYIAELQDGELAVWNPQAKVHQIYSVPENSFPLKSWLDIFYAYLVVCSIGIITFRYFKEKGFQDKILSVFTLFTIVFSAILAVL